MPYSSTLSLSLTPWLGTEVAMCLAGLRNHPHLQIALAFLVEQQEQFIAELIRICEIPAPPFQEGARAAYLAERFKALGLTGVTIDQEGNVIGYFPAREEGPVLVVSAHLDTVFPAGTDVTVRRVGTRLLAPGIADDTSGLAALLALIAALNAGEIRPRGALAFVATVGEEGEGNLRGVRYLFEQNPLGRRIANFISFDGPAVEFITHQALGSRRFRVTYTGPGGHSWGDFGVVNPVHALGRMVAKLADYNAPLNPRTTYSVGRIEGGESVNVIPERARCEIDLRSAATGELVRLEQFLYEAVRQAAAEENRMRYSCRHKLGVEVQRIGERPAGETPVDSRLVQMALAASRTFHLPATLHRASTDSNLPISLGIPAITIGVGGSSADSHRLTEWYDPTGHELGLQRALLLILGMTGIA